MNKVVVTRYRIFLENRHLAAGTINGRLAAVRRLAYEAADAGLLSPELAAGIRRVKGAKKRGVRLGNWLTAEEATTSGNLLSRTRSKERGIVRFAPFCWAADSAVASWLILTSRICSSAKNTGPSLIWSAKATTFERCLCPSGSKRLSTFGWPRPVSQPEDCSDVSVWAGKHWGDGVTERVVWHVVKRYARKLRFPHVAPHDLRRSCAKLCHGSGGELDQIQVLLGHVSVQTSERYLGCKQRIRRAVNDCMVLSLSNGARSIGAGRRLYGHVDFRREMRPFAFVHPGAFSR